MKLYCENKNINKYAQSIIVPISAGVAQTLIDTPVEVMKMNKVLNIKPKPQFHAYLGVQSSGFTVNTPLFSGRILLECRKMNFGVQYIGIPTLNNQYGLLVEYKLF